MEDKRMATDKDESRSRPIPLRFTEMHNRLSEGVRDLIQLYYILEENEEQKRYKEYQEYQEHKEAFLEKYNEYTDKDALFKKYKEFKEKEAFLEKDREYSGYKEYQEAFLPVVKDLLKRVTGEDFEFNDKANTFVKGNQQISISRRQIKSFVHRMEELLRSTKQGAIFHFSPKKWIDRIETSIEEEPQITSVDDRRRRNIGPVNDIIVDPIISKLEGLIDKNAIKSQRKQLRQSIEESIRKSGTAKANPKSFKISSLHRRFYRVKALTEFGRQLLNTHPSENVVNVIPSINFDGWTTFTQIARSVLVSYHLVFGSFERIKICKQCNKLLFEKRAGRKDFCSDDCERKFKQASPIYKCWNRQTAWIRRVAGKVGSQVRKLGSRYDDTLTEYAPKQIYVSIDRDCQGCATCAIGEKCPTLKKKNEKIFSVQEELPAIEKEFSDRRIKRKDVVDKLKGLLTGTEDIAKRLRSLKIKK
jgi:hypothetical protein